MSHVLFSSSYSMRVVRYGGIRFGYLPEPLTTKGYCLMLIAAAYLGICGTPAVEIVATEEGLASYYAPYFHQRPTASGELYDTAQHTAAHREWPFGTVVRVTHELSGRSVEVRINDRGPFNRRRSIDLSLAAARELNMIEKGVVRVRMEVVHFPEPPLKPDDK